VQQIKGSVLKSRLAFVEQHSGRDGVRKVLDTLSADDRRTLGIALAVAWYPFELGKRLDEAIVRVLGGGRTDFFEKLGEASAEQNLATFHKGFVTRGDAHAFLAKAPAIYKLYYETGHREYQKAGDREGVLTTFDAETFSAPDCLTVVGWYRKALELCGIAGVRIVEESCRAKGAEVCRYRFRWS
jgi:hypothetical protein